MGAFSKSSRGIKRGASSSSSWASTAIMIVFVSFCVFGVYMLTSSSPSSLLSSSASPSDRHFSRSVLKNPHPPLVQPESGASEEDSSDTQQQKQQPKVEKNHHQQPEDGVDGIESQAQIEHDSEIPVDDHHIQQQRSDQEGNTIEEQQQQPQKQYDGRSAKQQADVQIDEEQQQQQQKEQRQVDLIDEEQQQKQNEEEQQQESQEHTNDSQEQQQLQQQVEEDRVNENQPRLQVEDDKTGSGSNPSTTTSFSDSNLLEEPSKSGGGRDTGDSRPWETQAIHPQNEEELKVDEEQQPSVNAENLVGNTWELCSVTAGPDYIPCLDNEKAIKKLASLKHYEHRERHCPEESPTCLVPLPKGYKRSIDWPKSRDKIWYTNVPHTKLAEVKGHQNWVKVEGEYLTFPGGGTQFIHGALHYIDFIQQSQRDIAWGKHTRVILDVGCGVASFGGYLFERDVITMSFAPKDEHEAQVQFALERGIPAISAVMGSQRLSFPSKVFDLVHCARCRVPWHADGGVLLLELNRVLRPGGYFVWSATPVYQKLKEDVEIWKVMSSLTISMCWDLVTIKKDKLNGVAAAIYRKPTSNECYNNRKHQNPPMCEEDDDPNAAWYVPLQACMHRLPVDAAERGTKWPMEWPRRLTAPPYWLNSSETGIYGKPTPDDFKADYDHWKHIVTKTYLNGLGINWAKVRNVMDMKAAYGGFAAALRDLKVWVMNVVNVDSLDTLPTIYERGLFGIYHDWCESFSTYPRTYDLLHADHLFSKLKERCSIVPVVTEIDRILRPGGKLIVHDESTVTSEVESLLKSLHWEVQLTFSKDRKGIIAAEKSDWRPEKYSAAS